ncbi:HAD family hydrolase [Luteipulveratus sp. YIM 133132]|uniref:HAD family hydrolase n=1 Tax=Luteipulveratus flavus TaxID=3031728 RepID=A0ABT6C3L7_9MICO|nr:MULTISPECIES: HAD family hydrolase [unclassified Luteipulveratus]MDE9364783.1 HAD family hydrolase [Luteipulveratus sp. YIM 133132]MDF8262659.1 HAD family hydrolase [Luteipulveratus sp. YIM 133296]
MTADTVLLDVDGTLIDSSYHHTIAWAKAFADEGLYPPLWTVHRAIGMGGDRLVPHVTDEETEWRCGDRVREGWERAYAQLVDDVHPFDGAGELVRALRERGLKVALASSGKERFTATAIEAIGVTRDDVDAVTTSADADASKPDPGILKVALDAAGGTSAIVVGDSTWDVEAAKAIDAPTLTVRTGGFDAAELTAAGAELVVDTVADLIDADWDHLRSLR